MLIEASNIIVLKLGSSTVVDGRGKFKKKWVTSLIKDIQKYGKNKKFVIVSSGAIALGQKYLKINKKKIKLDMSQAIAAVGQIHLASEFQKLFEKYKIKTGQILISPDDTEQRRRALNVRRTFDNLFKLNAIPIVNENDTTATAEIKYGDNDRLAARVAQIIGADTLIILSDVDGLYDLSNKKKIIKTVNIIDEKINSLIDNKKNNYGSGGISTKLDAAQICMNSGCHMLLANGNKDYPIKNIVKNKIYTHFTPKISSLDAKKKWIIGSLRASGKVFIDQGAARALYNGKSLLAAGVTKINGSFNKGENVLIVDHNEKHLARGLASFNSSEINKIKGKQSKEIEKILGYLSKSEIIHKDDMVML
ncbi:glutamate 5-kinase [Candidatus Pelagibacter bacterium]|jgi:glutamate 5-kinase|nr:glutamate 5-kinase [Candidatus Pelagibacter bacterium]MDA8772445.1 glutamate 5-kinase [Candidatus Pelagibacter bacterium]MDC1124667.1 glutamate 5-kinase [Pelagibacteraceae bacterium]|tara:strand:- start:291 stop:1382 length:1092 start_codon:yes stop_codon:yes gene_type:complete